MKKMVLVELHYVLFERLKDACVLYQNPDVTTLLNAVVLSFLNNVGFAPQSGIFSNEEGEKK